MTAHDGLSGQDPAVRPHEFDGIQEFDNQLPNWWLWSFYLAIIFSLFYWLHFHVLGTGNLPVAAYLLEKQQAEAELEKRMAEMEISNEGLAALVEEESFVSKGKEAFVALCATCHKADAGGNIGPNLTDKYWLHGGEPVAIYNTIFNGVPGTAMVSQKIHGVTKIQQITAYLLSIRDSNVAGGKAPDISRAKVYEQ